MHVLGTYYFIGSDHPGIGKFHHLPRNVYTSEEAMGIVKIIREEGYNAKVYLQSLIEIELPL